MKLEIAILLRLEKTHTIEQISDKLNVTEGAIRNRLRRYYNANKIPSPAYLNKPNNTIIQQNSCDSITSRQRDFYHKIVSYHDPRLGGMHQSPWYDGDFAFILENPRKLTAPIFCSGALGFWNVPPDIEMKIQEQLTQTN